MINFWIGLLAGALIGLILGYALGRGLMAESWCRSLDYEGVANFWSARPHEFKCYKVSGDIRVEQTFKWGKDKP